jgi:hypothetical protein
VFTRGMNRSLAAGLGVLLTLSGVATPAVADSTAAAPTTAPATTVPVPPPPPPPPEVSRKTVALGAFGIAAAALAGTVVLGVFALKNKSDYEKDPTYANTDNGNNFAAYADGCAALAVAAGATGLVLWLTSRTSLDRAGAAAKSAATFSVAPVVTTHGGGAGAVLRF